MQTMQQHRNPVLWWKYWWTHRRCKDGRQCLHCVLLYWHTKVWTRNQAIWGNCRRTASTNHKGRLNSVDSEYRLLQRFYSFNLSMNINFQIIVTSIQWPKDHWLSKIVIWNKSVTLKYTVSLLPLSIFRLQEAHRGDLQSQFIEILKMSPLERNLSIQK